MSATNVHRSPLAFYDREDRPWPNDRLTNAAIVGHTTTTTCRLWIRVWQPGAYWLVLSEEAIDAEKLEPVVKSGGKVTLKPTADGAKVVTPLQTHKRVFSYESDLTTVFDLEGLSAATQYHYALFGKPDRSNRWEIGRQQTHSFKTLKPDSETVTFGLYSCHMPYTKQFGITNLHMWSQLYQELKDAESDFAIGMGDQVYTDGVKYLNIWTWLRHAKQNLRSIKASAQVELMCSWYRDVYRGYWGPLALRQVLRSFPNYMIWDDHEIMDGWGSYTDKELSQTLDTLWEWEHKGRNVTLAKRMFRAARQVYHEYQHSHNPPTPKNQWDYSFRHSHCAFYVLDMRGQRNYNRDRSRILGEPQEKRLYQWLESDDVAEAEVVFIVTPVPMVHVSAFVANTFDLSLLGLADDLRDAWEHETNWEERDRLLQAVFRFSQSTGKRIIFLSGDVHIGAAFKLSAPTSPKARVYQITSSAITYATAPRHLLRLAVKEHATLEHSDDIGDIGPVTYHRLHIFNHNNFGIMRARREKSGAESDVSWDLYGNSGDSDRIIKLQRLKLNG